MNRVVTVTITSFAAFLAIGCSGGGTQSPNLGADPVLRFINASPNSNTLFCNLNESVVSNPVPYLGSSPNFIAFEPGSYDVTIGDPTNPETEDITILDIVRENNGVIFAVGLVTPPNTELMKRLRAVPVNVVRTAPNGNKARLVVVNGYNRAAGFDNPSIDFQNPGDNPQFAVRNIAFANVDNLEIDSGPQTFVARRNGTEFEITAQRTFTFGAGKIYAAIVSGIEGDGARPPKIDYIEIQSK